MAVPHDILLGLHWAFVGVTQVPPPWGARKVAPRQGRKLILRKLLFGVE